MGQMVDRKSSLVYDGSMSKFTIPQLHGSHQATGHLALTHPRPRWRVVGGLLAVTLYLLLWLTTLAAVQGAEPGQAALPAHSGLLLVGLEPSVSPRAADELFAGQGLITSRHWPEFGLAAVSVPTSGDERSRESALAAAKARLLQQPGVRYVENDWAIEAAAFKPPNDPYFSEQWALSRIHMPAAWEATLGDPALIVALIDSGIDLKHEDLTGMTIWSNEMEVNGRPGEDDDGNGFVDDFAGWDWVGNDNQIEDPYGHGTHVGGILTANTDNGIGVASVGRNLTILPLRVLDERGSGFISYLVDALAYARRKGVQIVNLSLILRLDSLAVADSIRAFVQTGGLVVAATGNYGNQVYWPAAYTETIAVAATSMDDSRAPFSNRGPETDLAAPGTLILSTYRNNSYYLNDGTSMAVPHVSALAALVWSLRPDWDWLQVKNHLKATATDVNAATLPGPDNDIGYGRIDAAAALSQAGAGVSFTVDYLAGQYTAVDQPLRIPVQVAVTDTNGELLPVVRALIHYELVGAPEIGSGESGPAPVLSGTIPSSATGSALIDLRMPQQVGQYELRVSMAGQDRLYPITLQDGPLVLGADAAQPVLHVGGEQTQLLFSAASSAQGELLAEPLLVELTTSLGTFSDGSQKRTLWLVNGRLTETLTTGQVAGVAEIGMNTALQSQRAFVTIRPGPTQRVSGPTRILVQDWGQLTAIPIRLELADAYGNPIWDKTKVNFYTLNNSFAPQSPEVVMGKIETLLSLPAWASPRVEYWALVPGSFFVFRGEVIIQRHHYWFPLLSQAATAQ